MNVMRIDGTKLNFWVAKSLGLKLSEHAPAKGERHDPESGFWHPQNFHPASDWSQAGPIVSNEWYVIEDILVDWFGPDWIGISAIVVDPLKWFMRAYVASQYGNDVEELITGDYSDSQAPDLETPSRFGAVRNLLSSQWSSLAGH